MENLKSIIVLNDVEFEAIQYAKGFDETLINKSEAFAFVSEREILTNKFISFGEGDYQLNVIYLKSPFSKLEFLRIDSELDIEKEVEHNLKLLLQKLGATSYKRVSYDGVKKQDDYNGSAISKSKAGVGTPKFGIESELEAGLDVNYDKTRNHFNSFDEEVLFTGLPNSNPKDNFENANQFAIKNNLLFIQDVRHLLDSFNPAINNGNVIKERAIKSISFEFVKSYFEASLNLALRCKAVLVTPKIGGYFSSENALKTIIHKQKEKLTIKELVVKF